MTGRAKLWRAVAVVFTLVNVVGAVYALAMDETMHAVTHLSLLAGGFVFWQVRRSWGNDLPDAVTAPQIDSHLDHLQQSVDAIAIEVERIGEGQRFARKVLEGKLAARDSTTPATGK